MFQSQKPKDIGNVLLFYSYTIFKSLITNSDDFAIFRLAIAHLSLLSKFKNPKGCFREADVRASYMRLLLHRNPQIQREAIECLLSYKHSYLVPYRQNLRDLIDEGKFRNALTHFQLGEEGCVVSEVHRAELMPIVIR